MSWLLDEAPYGDDEFIDKEEDQGTYEDGEDR